MKGFLQTGGETRKFYRNMQENVSARRIAILGLNLAAICPLLLFAVAAIALYAYASGNGLNHLASNGHSHLLLAATPLVGIPFVGTDISSLVEKRAKAAAAMREINDKATKDNRVLTSEEEQRFDAADADVIACDKQIDRIRKTDEASRAQAAFASTTQPPMLNISGAASEDHQAEFKQRYEKAFKQYLRHGVQSMEAEDRMTLQGGFRTADGKQIKAAQTVTTSGGGYLIPQGFMGKLEEALKYYGGILGVVSSFDTETGNPLPWPTTNDTANMGRILGINTQVTETDVTFGQVMFGAYVGCSDSVLVPIQLMQDAYFNLDDVLAKLLGTRLGRLMNNKLTVGSGTNEPSGIVTEAVAAGLTYTTASGQTGTIVGDDLIELEHKVDPAYRPQAKYAFNDSTLKAIKKLKDSYGRYLWLPGLAATDPNTINGYAYVINNDMAGLGRNGSPLVGNNWGLFGDLSKYQVRRVAGEVTLMRLVERYADYLQVGFQAFVRFDGKLLDAGTHPVAVGVQAAS